MVSHDDKIQDVATEVSGWGAVEVKVFGNVELKALPGSSLDDTMAKF
jgi:hypothetical protein